MSHLPEPSRPGKAAALRRRAQVLAQEFNDKPSFDVGVEVVAFQLGAEVYAIPSKSIRDVCTVREITHIPCVPPFIVGLIVVRGVVITVVDLRRLFRLHGNGICDLNKVLIVNAEGREIGILADLIIGVQTIAIENLQSSLPGVSGLPGEYLVGISRERIIVLDVSKIACSPHFLVNHEAPAGL